MQLPDKEIKRRLMGGDIIIEPFDITLVQPASIDVRLGRYLRTETGIVIDLSEYQQVPFVLAPNEFMLGHTMEYIKMPTDLSARVEGKSSIGRRGLAIHTSAGFIDPGFKGEITLELKNFTRTKHIVMEPGMLVGQIAFYQMLYRPEVPYGHPSLGSHYQDQAGPTPAWTQAAEREAP